MHSLHSILDKLKINRNQNWKPKNKENETSRVNQQRKINATRNQNLSFNKSIWYTQFLILYAINENPIEKNQPNWSSEHIIARKGTRAAKLIDPNSVQIKKLKN